MDRVVLLMMLVGICLFLWIQSLAKVGYTEADKNVDMTKICVIDAEVPVTDYTPLPTIPLVYLDKRSTEPVEAILEHNSLNAPKYIHPINKALNLAPRIFIEVDPSQMSAHGLVTDRKTKIITECKPSEINEPSIYYLFLVGGLLLIYTQRKAK